MEPAPGRFTHHLELYVVDDIDQDLRGWLSDARQAARRRGSGRPGSGGDRRTALA